MLIMANETRYEVQNKRCNYLTKQKSAYNYSGRVCSEQPALTADCGLYETNQRRKEIVELIIRQTK